MKRSSASIKNIKVEPNIYSAESWEQAKKLADFFSPIPNVISYCVSTLRNSKPTKSSRRISTVLRPIDKISTIKNALYFGAATLFPDQLLVSDETTSKELVTILQPNLYAALLTATYMLRRTKKLAEIHGCNHNNEEEFLQYMELGYILGDAIPSLGSSDGVILGALMQTALSAFMLKDSKKFENYRKSHKYYLDLNYEHKTFGCDRTQIGAYLVRMFGYSTQSLYDIRESLRGNSIGVSQKALTLETWTKCVPLIEQFANGKEEHVIFTDLALGVNSPDSIKEMCSNIMNSGTSFQWMKKGYVPSFKNPLKDMEDLENKNP
ncbi:MAG: hypothetical protein SGJ02_11330 [bacterium]|nr:hypothetical protein [bacterium]